MTNRITKLLIAATVCTVSVSCEFLQAHCFAEQNLPLLERRIDTLRIESHPPCFRIDPNTLDPLKLAREAQTGYLAHMCEPWGMLPGLRPTLRFYFDNRLLPWVELKHHGVDGFDNNSRNLGAHALLRDMQIQSGILNATEEGQIGYLLGITDPESGLPYNPDTLPRHCALGHGELAKNVILLYEQTEDPSLHQWAEKMLATLRKYAFVRHISGIGDVAEYHQGGQGGQGGFVVGQPPVAQATDTALDGWQHLYCGWNCWAFAKWSQVTGDTEALNFAVALANRLCNSSDEQGNDGSLRPDGSFGGTTSGSLHMHGHTHSLPGLILVGEELIAKDDREQGLRFIQQAQSTFDWLYDSSRNPDAGSMTGWLPEFLCVKSGWDRNGDCEGCTMGDVVQVAVMLADAHRLAPELEELDSYFDTAEQMFRGQVVASIFHPTPEYQELLRTCIKKRVAQELPQVDAATRDEEVRKRFNESMANSKRMNGRLLGLCGFGDWVNCLPSPLDEQLPGIDMMGCCADAVIRAAHAIWSHTVTGDEQETRVNLAFNHTSSLVEVHACLPHLGEVNVVVKQARKVLVRVPSWVQPTSVQAYVDKQQAATRWEGRYLVFDDLEAGQLLTVTYPLRIAEVTETIYTDRHNEYKGLWRGNTIVGISPKGRWLPIFHRPELDTETVP